MTKFGMPILEHLKLKNWHERHWFQAHRQKLDGTSTVYKVPSKEINGRSINLVVKWSRVGEEVPLDTLTFNRFAHAEFNSPFEEFALLMEMRESRVGPRLRTNRPLAIYVPPEQLKIWQTGRSRSRMARKKAKYRDVELDILRQYILVYEWVKGESADVALAAAPGKDRADCTQEVARLTERARLDMERKGYFVIDHKPAHVILRTRPNGSYLQKKGDTPYALVDFELLQRTTENEREVEAARRHLYLTYQRTRFDRTVEELPMPDHLKRVELFGVEYIWGLAESTHGTLWVVGRNPDLFDFFLPERWRHTPRARLSQRSETYHTISKDHIRLIWKISKVGETPEPNSELRGDERLSRHGFNSPFEEFSAALTLAERGVSVVYPRAIYRAGLESPRAGDYSTDTSRFQSHRMLKAPDGQPVLEREYNYITLWGYWQGHISDEDRDRPACTGIDLSRAVREGLITADAQRCLLNRAISSVRAAGFDTERMPTHFLLSRDEDGKLRKASDGNLAVTLCNFELIHALG